MKSSASEPGQKLTFHEALKQKQRKHIQPKVHLPPFTGDNTSPFLLPQSIQPSRLPPLVITGISHVKNITIFETKSLAGETAVLCFVVVKQSPG